MVMYVTLDEEKYINGTLENPTAIMLMRYNEHYMKVKLGEEDRVRDIVRLELQEDNKFHPRKLGSSLDQETRSIFDSIPSIEERGKMIRKALEKAE